MTLALLSIVIAFCVVGLIAGGIQGELLKLIRYKKATQMHWRDALLGSLVPLFLAEWFATVALKPLVGEMATAHLLIRLAPYSVPLWVYGLVYGWRTTKPEAPAQPTATN